MSQRFNAFQIRKRRRASGAQVPIAIAMPAWCDECVKWQRGMIIEAIDYSAELGIAIHMEIDSPLASELINAAKIGGDHITAYSAAQSIEEYASWYGEYALAHTFKRFGNIYFCNNLQIERDKEMIDSVDGLLVFDCHHAPYRSLLGVVPTSILGIGIITRRFTSRMLNTIEGNMAQKQGLILLENDAKKLVSQLSMHLTSKQR